MKLILTLTLGLTIQIAALGQDSTAITKFIQDWWKVPYRYGGSTKYGIDCSKYAQKFYEEVFGTKIPGICSQQWKESERVPKDSLKTGDLVFFYSPTSPSKWHVGVYLWQGLFVHSANRRDNMKISSLEETAYRRNYRGAGRIPRA